MLRNRLIKSAALALPMFFWINPANSAPYKCLEKAVYKEDLAQGEMVLNQSDIVKPRLIDQNKIATLAHGEPSIVLPTEYMTRYKLKAEKGWKWIAATAEGFYGKNREGAWPAFAKSVRLDISYFRASRKILITSLTPYNGKYSPQKFWVFVHVPNEANEIYNSCGTFT